MNKTKRKLTALPVILIAVVLSTVVVMQSQQTASAAGATKGVVLVLKAAKDTGAKAADLRLVWNNGPVKEVAQKVPVPNNVTHVDFRAAKSLGEPYVSVRDAARRIAKVAGAGTIVGSAVAVGTSNQLDGMKKNTVPTDSTGVQLSHNISVKVWGLSIDGKSYEELPGVIVALRGSGGCKGGGGNYDQYVRGYTMQGGQVLFRECKGLPKIELDNIPSNYTKDANYANREMVQVITMGESHFGPVDLAMLDMPQDYFDVDIILPNKNELTVKSPDLFPSAAELISGNKKTPSIFDINKAAKQQAAKEAEANDRCRKTEVANNTSKVRPTWGSGWGGMNPTQKGQQGTPGYTIGVDSVLEKGHLQKYRNPYKDDECTNLHYSREYEIKVNAIDVWDKTRSSKPMNEVGVTVQFHGPGRCGGTTVRSESRPHRVTNNQGVARFTQCSANNINLRFSSADNGKGFATSDFKYAIGLHPNRPVTSVLSYPDPKSPRVVIEVKIYRTYPDKYQTKFDQATNYYWRKVYDDDGQLAVAQQLQKSRVLNFLGGNGVRCRPGGVQIGLYEDRSPSNGNSESFARARVLGASKASGGAGYCRISYNVHDSPSLRFGFSGALESCNMYAHEYGHLLGFKHESYSKGRTDLLVVMDPSLNDTAEKVSGCHGVFTYGDPSWGQTSTGGDREGRGSPR